MHLKHLIRKKREMVNIFFFYKSRFEVGTVSFCAKMKQIAELFPQKNNFVLARQVFFPVIFLCFLFLPFCSVAATPKQMQFFFSLLLGKCQEQRKGKFIKLSKSFPLSSIPRISHSPKWRRRRRKAPLCFERTKNKRCIFDKEVHSNLILSTLLFLSGKKIKYSWKHCQRFR